MSFIGIPFQFDKVPFFFNLTSLNLLLGQETLIPMPAPISSAFRSLNGHMLRVTTLQWNPLADGKLASVSYDGTAQVWISQLQYNKVGIHDRRFEKLHEKLERSLDKTSQFMIVSWSFVRPVAVQVGLFDIHCHTWFIFTMGKSLSCVCKVKVSSSDQVKQYCLLLVKYCIDVKIFVPATEISTLLTFLEIFRVLSVINICESKHCVLYKPVIYIFLSCVSIWLCLHSTHCNATRY